MNSWSPISDEDVPLPVRDRAGRATDETRRQPRQTSATQVAIRLGVDDCGECEGAMRNYTYSGHR